MTDMRRLARRFRRYLKAKSKTSKVFAFLLRKSRELRYVIRFKYRYAVDPSVVLFESYHGDKYNCNPKAIYEAMRDDPRYENFLFVWAVSDRKKYTYLAENYQTVVVKVNSRTYYKYCASARYWVSNLLMRPWITPKKEQIYIETWHGKPIKRIGCNRKFDTDRRKSREETFRHFAQQGKRFTYLLSPCPYFTPIMLEAFDLQRSKRGREKIRETGYPRNDALLKYTPESIEEIKARYGIPQGKKVVLYAPTWRDLFDKEKIEVTTPAEAIELERLSEELGEDCFILYRLHHADAHARIGGQDRLRDVTNVENVNDLYAVSDLLVSDYSGTILDFAVLKRPMVYFMYDKEQYTQELSGVNIDFDDLPGPIVESRDDLARAIRNELLSFQLDENYLCFIEKYCPLDDGHAAERAVEMCIPPEMSLACRTPALSLLERKFHAVKWMKRQYKKMRNNCIAWVRACGIFHSDNSRKIEAYHNYHQGQRCFLIGNGPSLTASDLELIQGEICLACNMIYRMFPIVTWRPKYYCVSDVIYTKNMSEEIVENISCPIFLHSGAFNAMKVKPPNRVIIKNVPEPQYKIRGNLQAYYIPSSATVMTFMLELAMYMGFREIYLLGVDHTNSFTSGHFAGEYVLTEVDKKNLFRARRTLNNPQLTLAELGEYRRQRGEEAYRVVRDYADKHGFHIYNATRGGALEVFERVDLDRLKLREEGGT